LNSVAAASPFFLTASACSTFLSRLYRREKEKIVTGKFRVKLTSNMRVIVEKQTYRKEEEVFTHGEADERVGKGNEMSSKTTLSLIVQYAR
jgi:hypothetical protein